MLKLHFKVFIYKTYRDWPFLVKPFICFGKNTRAIHPINIYLLSLLLLGWQNSFTSIYWHNMCSFNWNYLISVSYYFSLFNWLFSLTLCNNMLFYPVLNLIFTNKCFTLPPSQFSDLNACALPSVSVSEFSFSSGLSYYRSYILA